jgi:hypothetical protein
MTFLRAFGICIKNSEVGIAVRKFCDTENGKLEYINMQ